MSDLRERVKRYYQDVKASITGAIAQLIREYETEKVAAGETGELVSYGFDISWNMHWEDKLENIPKGDYCRILTATESMLNEIELRLQIIVAVNPEGLDMQEMSNYLELRDFKLHIKDIIEILRALCTLQTNLKGVNDILS